MPLLEALACAAPALAARAGALPEVGGDAAAWIDDAHDPDAWAASLRALLADERGARRARVARTRTRGGVFVGSLHERDARRAGRGRGRAVRALLVVRPDAFAKRGGDVAHAEHAARALREIAVEADVVATDAPDARGYDVAHVFGVFEPETARRQIAALRSHRVPLVLSPIWLDLRELFAIAPRVERALAARDAAAVERRLSRLAREAARLPWRGGAARNADRRLAAQRELVRAADVLVPASEVEAYLCGVRLGVSNVPFVVAPLGTDHDAFDGAPAGTRAGILCAGRIEPKKNQAALLYALRDVDVDVTIVGGAYDARYLALCKRWATPRTRFVQHVERDALRSLMAAAAVHAHPSWLETPGLSSLEAAACGARIVTGDRGCEREYFGPDVDYADPADPSSIRAAVLRALDRGARPDGDALSRRLAAFTWRRHAEATAGRVRSRDRGARVMRILVAAEHVGHAGGMERYLEIVLPALVERGMAVHVLARRIDAIPPGATARDRSVGGRARRAERRRAPCGAARDRGIPPGRRRRAQRHGRRRRASAARRAASRVPRARSPAVLSERRPFVSAHGAHLRAADRHRVRAARAHRRLRVWTASSHGDADPAARSATRRDCGGGRRRRRVDLHARYRRTQPHPARSGSRRYRRRCPTARTRTARPGALRSVVFAGRIVPQKGVDVLVRAIAGIDAPSRPSLDVLGDGPALASALEQASRLGVTVRAHGVVGPDAVRDAMDRAALVALPSMWAEPFGYVGIEAFARARPVVAFDVGGVRDWLETA